MAVHSMKDMPAQFPESLIIGGVSRRVDVRDCLISNDPQYTLQSLPNGAVVGTSSLRRASQLKAYRPDLVIRPIRGNIHTRMRKLETEGMDAIILAAAGLSRVGWKERVNEYIPVDICIPAVGQGALAVQCREDHDFVRHLLSLYNHEPTYLEVSAERSFLSRMDGNCQVPIAAYAQLDQTSVDKSSPVLTLVGMVGNPDGSVILKEQMTGSNPHELGLALAERLIERGADKLLSQLSETDQDD